MDHAALDFHVIRELLAGYAVCPGAKTRALNLEPQLNLSLCKAALRETGDARAILAAQGSPPLAMMEQLEEALRASELDILLSPGELQGVAVFCSSCRRMETYLKKSELLRVELSLSGRGFAPLEELQREIETCIRDDRVADGASPQLKDLRRRMEAAGDKIRKTLNAILRGHPAWFADGYVAQRAGKPTLPLRSQFRSQLAGQVVDRSQTGGTLFVEPASVHAAQAELDGLRVEEENETRRILYALTAMVADAAPRIRENSKLMERLDFAFAKGRMSLEMDAREVPVAPGRQIRIVGGRHPLLGREQAVPLHFSVGVVNGDAAPLRGVIVTGPNTGGKTVALKTIGLFALMAQSGLHLPTGEGSCMSHFNRVLCDIGDGQSIAENLSTFSAHMTRVLEILRTATEESLVLLDELGSGTDPAEGMGLAVAILDELVKRGCLFVATTHYPQIKEYARLTEGVQNARMAFDPVTLAPLYLLELGEAGESCALHIAGRLGFPAPLLERARRAAYEGLPAAGGGPEGCFGSPGGAPRLTDYREGPALPSRARQFKRGDSVRVFPQNEIGIVCEEADERGTLAIQLRDRKRTLSYKRLRLLVPAEQLYPENYDFSIIFDTVANRKARHTMTRKHDPAAVVRIREGAIGQEGGRLP